MRHPGEFSIASMEWGRVGGRDIIAGGGGDGGAAYWFFADPAAPATTPAVMGTAPNLPGGNATFHGKLTQDPPGYLVAAGGRFLLAPLPGASGAPREMPHDLSFSQIADLATVPWAPLAFFSGRTPEGTSVYALDMRAETARAILSDRDLFAGITLQPEITLSPVPNESVILGP
jgi:hypothetical protein